MIEIFRQLTQQDAHEFFNFLINDLSDTLTKSQRSSKSPNHLLAASQKEQDGYHKRKSWIHELFEGRLSNETRCLVCESVRSVFVSSLFMMMILLVSDCFLRSYYF